MKKTLKITLVLLAVFVAQTAGAHVVNGVDTHTGQLHNVTTNLKLGSKGDEVKLLQETLAKVPNIYPEGLITGYFGALTLKAVKRFQSENGLDQVGNVGPKTRALLNGILNGTTSVGDVGYLVPQINELFSTSTSASSAYVFWTSNKLSTSQLWYSLSSPATTTPVAIISDNNKSLSHSHNIYGLATSTTYYYVVKITDDRGNSATSTEKTFVTMPN